MEQSWLDSRRTDRPKHAVTHPVFTDPSGRRRRLMLIVGAGASMLCVAALIVVGTGLVGGSNTPFALWGAPHSPTVNRPGGTGAPHHHHGHRGDPPRQPGSKRPSSPASTPSPKADNSQSPAPSPSPSPSPRGKRHGRSKSPNPHSPSPHPHTKTPRGHRPADAR